MSLLAIAYEQKVVHLLTVHDDIILECCEDSAFQVPLIFGEVMENAGKEFLTKVPISAEAIMGNNWADK